MVFASPKTKSLYSLEVLSERGGSSKSKKLQDWSNIILLEYPKDRADLENNVVVNNYTDISPPWTEFEVMLNLKKKENTSSD